MIASLRFDENGNARFEPATNVRIDAVCSVANSVSEHFSRLLERDLSIDVFEPVFVPLGSHPALFANAFVFLAHARHCDLLVVFRSGDARRLAACAFREEPDEFEDRELSPHEERVLERLGRELANLCAPLCGEISSFVPANGPVEKYECATYFELRIASPVDVTIGLGLSRDPAPASDEKIAPAALLGVPLEVRARIARAKLTARALSQLQVGSVVPFETALTDPATLLVGKTPIARGECGTRGDALAFNVTERLWSTT